MRYPTLLAAILLWAGVATGAAAEESAAVMSPDGKVRWSVEIDKGRPRFVITLRAAPVIDSSPLRLSVDGVDITDGVRIGEAKAYTVDETYPTLGVHAQAVNRCKCARFPLEHAASKTAYTLDVRAFNDAVAFRFVVPGGEKPRVPDEATAFAPPARGTAWHHNLRGHYEGFYEQTTAEPVTADTWVAPPLTIKLPGGTGYAAITEAALVNYPGMALQADGHCGFTLRLGHKHPISYPFELRFKPDIERVSKPAAVSGEIVTPWRVVMVGADLNALVNCDVLTNLNPPPDPKLFPQGPATSWIQPGPAVWKYLDGGASTLEGAREFSRQAGELGFKHLVIEGYWQRWKDEEIKDLVAFARQRNVGIWGWSNSKPLQDPNTRRRLFDRCKAVGLVGVKLDFFDHEAKELIDFYETLLRETAERQLLVNFHGSNKPTGTQRTWPNELTREAVRGMEGLRNKPVKARHDVILPFTRCLAGPADYTPVHFGRPGNGTSWPHEIASAAIITSPLLTYAANPANILKNPGVEMMKSTPSVWDETRVLPPSEVGDLAVFARRRGDTWFLAVMNGPSARTIQVPLGFLSAGKHAALLLRDRSDDAAAMQVEKTVLSPTDVVKIELRDGGGFVGRFSKE
jgi:alpha-glucosidase